jgi:molecular chaperone DnaJ
MAAFKNYYEILGVEPYADADAVKAAFRKLARQHHPDLNGNNRQAEEKFKEINEAYEVLSSPEKRALHDAALQAMGRVQAKAGRQTTGQTKEKPADKQAPPPKTERKTTGEESTKAGKPINELFESFLKKGFSERKAADPDEPVFRSKPDGKAGGKTHREAPRRGEDVVVKTGITPQEAMDGVVKTVNVQHNEICRRCSGTGKVNGAACSACHGEKVTVRLKKIDVRIPAGVKNGSRVRVAKEGARGVGGAENGDLFLQIEILYDASLRIEGLDVYGEVAVSVTDAVLGTELEVNTLNGPVRMSIPPGTQTGKTFRLKEQGVQNALTRGDHYVTVTVKIPESLSPKEKELYQELARLQQEKARQNQ